MEKSEIANYYADKSILITGATGFLGKVLIEKLLRSCPDVKKIYVLVRHKKGNTPEQRIADLLNGPLFEPLSQSNPDFKTKLVAIEGDLMLPDLGISAEDEKKLIDNVNVVFHSAATVRFDEPIKLAVKMNILGTKKVIDLCKKMSQLESFVHVSTAYANCNRTTVDEKVYEASVDPYNMIDFAEWIPNELAEQITPSLIGTWPNTYTYTKAIAESLVVKECQDKIPCSIVRPAIVGASYSQPVPGWIDNYNAATGILAAVGKGLKRTMYGNMQSKADIIPVDYTVNMMIVAGWGIGAKKSICEGIPVYNNTIGQQNKADWTKFIKHTLKGFQKYPLENSMLLPGPGLTLSRRVNKVRHAIEEVLPAHLIDLYLKAVGQKPKFIRLQEKISKAALILEYFATHDWQYAFQNIINIEKEMSETDRKIFNIDVKEIDWEVYMENYCLGIKKYLLKEDMSKLKNYEYSSKKISSGMHNVGFALIAFTIFMLIWFTLLSYLIFSS